MVKVKRSNVTFYVAHTTLWQLYMIQNATVLKLNPFDKTTS